MRSISLASARPTAQHNADVRISAASARRLFSLSFLESAKPLTGLAGFSITAAATTGPTMQPRPTSSIPATSLEAIGVCLG